MCVQVWSRSGGVWTAESPLWDGPTNSRFGSAMSLDAAGDMAAIGADGHMSNRGSVFIYRRISGVWGSSAAQTLAPSDCAGTCQFGFSLSLSSLGSTLAIGAPGGVASGVGAWWSVSTASAAAATQ